MRYVYIIEEAAPARAKPAADDDDEEDEEARENDSSKTTTDEESTNKPLRGVDKGDRVRMKAALSAKSKEPVPGSLRKTPVAKVNRTQYNRCLGRI